MHIIRQGRSVTPQSLGIPAPDEATVVAVQQRGAQTAAQMSLAAQIMAARYRAAIAGIKDPDLRAEAAAEICIGVPYGAVAA